MRQKSWMGWMELIVGILLLAGGIYTLMRPGNSLVGISFLYGCLAVFTGALDILFYVNMERRTGFSPVLALVTGILDIIAGVILLFQPAVGAWVLVWVFPIWFIAHCISQLAHLSVIRMISGSAYYYFSLIVNIIGLILGIFMLVNPFLTMVSVPYMIGCYLIFLGIDGIVLALATFANHL